MLLLCCLSHRYIAWQVHEKVEGQYDFEGGNDFVDFTQLAGSLGLLVIIRAGKLNEKRDNTPHIPQKRRSLEFVSSIAETEKSILKWNLFRAKWRS